MRDEGRVRTKLKIDAVLQAAKKVGRQPAEDDQ